MGAARIADLFRCRGKGTLETELNMIKPGLGEGFDSALGDSNARCYEIGIDTAPGKTGNQLGKIGSKVGSPPER